MGGQLFEEFEEFDPSEIEVLTVIGNDWAIV
jgi:hypothetical protein